MARLQGQYGVAVPVPKLLGRTPANAGGAVCSAGRQTAAQLRLHLKVGMRAGEWNLHSSAPTALGSSGSGILMEK